MRPIVDLAEVAAPGMTAAGSQLRIEGQSMPTA
jgi:hypothetical protein